MNEPITLGWVLKALARAILRGEGAINSNFHVTFDGCLGEPGNRTLEGPQ